MTCNLQQLRDKVAAGEFWGDAPRPHMLATDLCWRAFNGSLDAAKALHDAILPGSEWFLDCRGSVDVWGRSDGNRPRSAHSAHNPARAWLLAILDAMIQGEKAEGDMKAEGPT